MRNSVLVQLSQVPLAENIGCVYQVIPGHVTYTQGDVPNSAHEPYLSGISFGKSIPASSLCQEKRIPASSSLKDGYCGNIVAEKVTRYPGNFGAHILSTTTVTMFRASKYQIE